MKNFLGGLLLGVVCTYWYLTQGQYVRELAQRWWERASAPAPIEQLGR